MGWFEEQITMRKNSDSDAFEDSCLRIAGSVMGQKMSAALHDEREQATDAIGEILKYYRVKKMEVPDRIKDIDDVLEYLLRPHGIMTREVALKDNWRKDASGAMLTTFAETGKVVAVVPTSIGGYKYLDPETGVMVRVTKASEKLFSKEAIAFYKPFPNKKLTRKEIIKYISDNVDRTSLDGYRLFGFLATLIGMLVPWLTNILFKDVVSLGHIGALNAVACFMVCATVSNILFSSIKDLFLQRIALRLNQTVEAATMMRILTLPSEFFKEYSSGDLSRRVQNMSMLITQLVNLGLSSFVTAMFSLIYLIQIFAFAPSLAVPAVIITLLELIVIIAAVIARTKVNTVQLEYEAKESGLSYSLITGIEKIKLAGAEKRAFAKWGKAYADQAQYLYDPPKFVKISQALASSIPLIGWIILYSIAIHNNVGVSEYYAFNSAYGMVTVAFAELVLMIAPASQVVPILAQVRPIMEAVPEVSEEKPVIERLSGGVELTNVTFRYQDDMPLILNNISLKIRPGQYVAITGKTGCGKSTLMRILLGFETPQKGAVYYDGRDLKSIDLKSLRSKIGTVMQNGSLFTGDLYSNIVISAPELTLDDAWEAARMAGLEDDIKAMPMNMFTLVSEGSGGISGGQKQRLMIARAIAPKPKILMFDEATSALDNITQKQVSDSLDSLKCTRIVIAHRLSTIRNCDRIIVLDEGKIVEDGNYDELMAKNGYFSELVKRQQVEG